MAAEDAGARLQEKLVFYLEKQNEMIEMQNAIMKDITSSLASMGRSIENLERISSPDRNRHPFPRSELKNYEPAWRVVYDTISARMKLKADGWRSKLDGTLIFVALFVTVITAFQTPVSQNLSPNPADLTNEILGNLTSIVYQVAVLNGLKVPNNLAQPQPFEPSQSDEILTFFWSISLLYAIIGAFFSVLGKRWVDGVTHEPLGHTYKEKAVRLGEREDLAEENLAPLLGMFYILPVASIIMFIIGFVYQLWTMALSGSVTSKILLATSVISCQFVLGTILMLVINVVHGVAYEESPFSHRTFSHFRMTQPDQFMDTYSIQDLREFFCRAIMGISSSARFDNVSSIPLISNGDEPEDSETIDTLEAAATAAEFVLRSDASLKAKKTVAWNLLRIRGLDCIVLEEPDRVAECRLKLVSALEFIRVEFSVVQEEARTYFLIAEMVVFITFLGKPVSKRLHDEEQVDDDLLLEVIPSMLALEREGIMEDEQTTFFKLKETAVNECERIKVASTHLFENIVLPDGLLVELGYSWDDESPDTWRWAKKLLNLIEREHITELLHMVSLDLSIRDEEDFTDLIRVLYHILESTENPPTFPPGFDISKLFLTSDLSLYNMPIDQSSITAIDVLLCYISLMDSHLLLLQRGLPGFMKGLLSSGLQSERGLVVPGIAPVSIEMLLGQVTDLPDDDEKHCTQVVDWTCNEGESKSHVPLASEATFPSNYGPSLSF